VEASAFCEGCAGLAAGAVAAPPDAACAQSPLDNRRQVEATTIPVLQELPAVLVLVALVMVPLAMVAP